MGDDLGSHYETGLTIDLPDRFAQRLVTDDNTARQLLAGAARARLERNDGWWLVATDDEARYRLRARGETPLGQDGFELPRDVMNALPSAFPDAALRWVTSARPSNPAEVLEQLRGRFALRVADPATGARGLRIPQAGALHAVLAHWSTGAADPATVVLPTGTGKTETMLSLFGSERLERVLILVPSDRLRIQIADKFETYGVLPQAGVLDRPTLGPVVGRVEHHFANVASMRSFVECCNIIVATPSALNASGFDVISALIERCSHLFVDEAHHVSATTWTRVRDGFAGKPVVQFTATPFS